MAAPTDTIDLTANTTVLTEHREYLGAQRVVDRLSDAGFPVEHLSIIGRDLVTLEDITGRRRYGRAALSGAASGAAVGLFLALALSLLAILPTLVSLLVLVLAWVAIGAVAGAIAGLIGHALHRGERDFSSVAGVTPTRFEVLVDAGYHDRAVRQLEQLA